MSLIDSIRSQVALPRREPQKMALAVMGTERSRRAPSNVKVLRAWSERSEWIRAAINIRKTQVAGAEWDIGPVDPERAVDVGLQRELTNRLEFANPKSESFQVLMDKVLEDLLVLDAGTIEIETNLRGEPLYLHDVDGGTVRVSELWDGTDPNEKRYFWYPDNFVRGSWRNDEMIYIMETPRTHSVVGLSKLETLAMSIDAELEGAAYNARMVRNAAPDGLLHLGKGAKQNNIDSFRAFWQAEQQRGAMAITGGTEAPEFIKFHDSNRDMQFQEWQIYLVRKIAAVMMMDPGDLGLGMDINRSTAEVRDSQTEDRGIRPLLSLLARHLTREFVWNPMFGGQDNNLQFRWTKLNLKESMAQAQIFKIALGGMPYKPVNEARKQIGLDPLGPEFDQLAMVTPQGAFSLEGLPTIGEFLEIAHPKPAPSAGPPSVAKEIVVPTTAEIASEVMRAIEPRLTKEDRLAATIAAMENGAQTRLETILAMRQEPVAPATIQLVPKLEGFTELAAEIRDAVKAMSERPQEPPQVTVQAAEVHVPPPIVKVDVPAVDTAPFVQAVRDLGDQMKTVVKATAEKPPKPKVITRKTVKRDEAGRITEVVEEGE